MKRLDNGRPSLVDFLKSIKFSRERRAQDKADGRGGQFAQLRPVTRQIGPQEDAHLIRSAN